MEVIEVRFCCLVERPTWEAQAAQCPDTALNRRHRMISNRAIVLNQAESVDSVVCLSYTEAESNRQQIVGPGDM